MENETLKNDQVYPIKQFLSLEINRELKEKHPDLNKYELREFMWRVVDVKLSAILCTINSTALEDIIKIVHEKLNINDLFENRQQYLN